MPLTAPWGKMVPLLLGVFSYTLHTLSLLSVGRSALGAILVKSKWVVLLPALLEPRQHLAIGIDA